MKTNEFLYNFKSARRQVVAVARKAMLIKMVADNIADLIPKGWQCTPTYYGLRFKPFEGATITPDMFDKLMAKLAKVFNYEPSKNVSPEIIQADFYVYPVAYDRKEWGESINLEFVIGNTEKCDFIVTQVTRDESQPTGYCKLLKEKKYLLKMEVN